MSWKIKEQLRETLNKEKGYISYPPGAGARSRFAFAYPNSYYVGMSNLGLHILYDILNRRQDTACERFFLPEKRELEEYRRTHTPLLSMENQLPLADFAVIGFAVSFEMDYFNVLEMLELGKVPLRASERGEDAPIVIAGGPCATFNPEPLSLCCDAFLIGEGEETLQRFLDAFYAARREGKTRREILRTLAEVPGIYVPSLYRHAYCTGEDGEETLASIEPLDGAPAKVERQWVRDLDRYPAHTVIVTEQTEFNLYLVETARGCGRHCRFCMAGYCFRRPRNRSLAMVEREVRDALPYGKRIGLMGAAISDYPEIDRLCRSILGEGLSMSVASFRADSVTEELVQSLAASGLKTLTIAPEAGSKRMRAIINKGITEEHVVHAMELGLAAGIRNFRLYFMIGLPFEEDDDIDAIADLALRLAAIMQERGSKGTLTLSINPFIPKPFTPFQWLPMEQKKIVERRLKRIRDGVRDCRRIQIVAESAKSAYVQGVLARGGRRVAEALHLAHESGGSKAFSRALKEAGILPERILYRERGEDEIFPWNVLDMGLRRGYLYEEMQRAKKGKATEPCFNGCHRCGVC